MTDLNPVLPPMTERSNLLRWLRKNLFGSWYDALLTFIGVVIAYWVVKGFFTWVFTTAEWEVISVNARLLSESTSPPVFQSNICPAMSQ